MYSWGYASLSMTVRLLIERMFCVKSVSQKNYRSVRLLSGKLEAFFVYKLNKSVLKSVVRKILIQS